MATKLQVYNRALSMLGERRIMSLTSNRESRRLLDTVYDEVKAYCLEQGMWIWAMRTVSATAMALPSIAYGFKNAFTRPSDVIHTYFAANHASMKDPLTHFLDDGNTYFSDSATTYVRYTSDDNAWGNDLARWSYTFAKFVSAELAAAIAFNLTKNMELAEKLMGFAKILLFEARALDSPISKLGLLPRNGLYVREFNNGADPPTPWPFPTSMPSEKDES